MPFCPRCTQESPEGARFCAGCGIALTQISSDKASTTAPLNTTGKGKKRTWFWLVIVGVLLAIGAVVATGQHGSGQSSESDTSSHTTTASDTSSSSTSDTSSEPDVLAKGDEIARARNGPTATQVEGNPDKWSGSYVRFQCKIDNVVQLDDASGANATCGQGVVAKMDTSIPSVDYTDPDAMNKALAKQQREADQYEKQVQDQAMLVLKGDKTANFDGGQIVTITGPVLGTIEGKNGMGATTEFPTVRVDYAE